MNNSTQKILPALLLIYGLASLIHFVHNAEFLTDYPNLPASWSRGDIYSAWIILTLVGIGGWVLVVRGFARLGFLLLAVYAVFGMDSLGHYVLAPMSEHTLAMNTTILLEVTTAALVLMEVMRQMLLYTLQKRATK